MHLRLRREYFSLIASSLELLTLNETGDALTLDVYRLVQDESRRLLNIESQIIHLCGPLVVATDGIVTLIHAPVKDYLTKDCKLKYTSTFFMNLNSSMADQYIADRCLCMSILPKFGVNKTITAILRKIVGLEKGEDYAS